MLIIIFFGKQITLHELYFVFEKKVKIDKVIVKKLVNMHIQFHSKYYIISLSIHIGMQKYMHMLTHMIMNTYYLPIRNNKIIVSNYATNKNIESATKK